MTLASVNSNCLPYMKSRNETKRCTDHKVLVSNAQMNISVTKFASHNVTPEEWPGMLHVTLLSGISGLSFDSPFLSPLFFLFFLFFLPWLLLLFLSCHFSANGPFFWLFFFFFLLQKTLKYFSLRVRLFCMALVEQLGDDSW